jgi:serine/threonine protein kinase
MTGIAQGLKFLHANAIIHRDMKPDNVLIDENMQPKITDFGTAKIQDTLTQTKGVGTPTYIAPEVITVTDGKAHYDSAVDVYAFALILWAIWKREEPFQNFQQAWQIMKYVVDEEGRPSLEGCPAYSLASLITRCWLPRPDARPKMPQICDELNTVTAELAFA